MTALSWIEQSIGRFRPGMFGAFLRNADGQGGGKSGVFLDGPFACGITGSDHQHSEVSQAIGNGVCVVISGRVYADSDGRGAGCAAATVLKEYDRGGWRGVQHMDAEASMVLWDGRKETLYFLRDRAGLHRLYILDRPDGLWFSTQIRALIDISERRFDALGLGLFLHFGWGSGLSTLYKGIGHMPQARSMQLSLGDLRSGVDWRARLESYWQIGAHPLLREKENALPLLTGALDLSLTRRVGLARQAGVFLSGGVDSVAVMAALRHHGSIDATGFHALAEPESACVAGALDDDACKTLASAGYPIEWTKREELGDQYYERWRRLSQISASYEADGIVTVHELARRMREWAGVGAACFTGECNVIDIGLSEVQDPSAGIKRYCYGSRGSWLARFPLRPFGVLSQLNRAIVRVVRPGRAYRRMDYLFSLLGAVGNPVQFYAGRLVGAMALPGLQALVEQRLDAMRPQLGREVQDYVISTYVRPFSAILNHANPRPGLPPDWPCRSTPDNDR